jgi:hypothetical protein
VLQPCPALFAIIEIIKTSFHKRKVDHHIWLDARAGGLKIFGKPERMFSQGRRSQKGGATVKEA